jgi:outer membrane lipoprotein LolB
MNLQLNASKPHQHPRLLLTSLVGSCVIILSGCQSTLKAPVLPPAPVVIDAAAGTEATTDNSQSNTADLPQNQIDFSITGKIGVRTPKQNGSAFYAWTQVNDRFAIDLTGALGIGQTHIEGVPKQVTLNSAKTGLLTAETPEELLQQATGWQAPISYLVYWINAQPAEKNAIVSYDPQQRLSNLQEGGWNVTFNYPADEKLPNKLTMTQPLDSGENRVTLTVQSRSDAVQ